MTEAAEGENADARDREHAKEEESAFTRIPVDPSRPPLWSARLTLRRASLQIGHATTHRSTLSRTLSSPLPRLVFSVSLFPFPPSTTTTTTTTIVYHHRRHHHRRSGYGRARAPSPLPPSGFFGPLAPPLRHSKTPQSRRQLLTSPPRTPSPLSNFPPSSFSHLLHLFVLPRRAPSSPSTLLF